MPRSLWSGTLSFGLVNVPVRLHSAVKDRDMHFTQLHEADGAPIETRRFCSEEDVEVRWEDIASGYDLDGEQVIVTDDDLAAVAPRKTKTIEISAFVDLADVDPIYFDHPYFLVPAGDSEGPRRAYRLLVDAMGGSDRAALGRFVLRTKEYLVLVRVRDGLLALTTLRFHDEVRPTKGIGTGGKKPASKQLDQAVKLIESLSSDWDPSRYRDEYRKRLQAVVKRKKQGKTITVPTAEEVPAPAADLMAALEKSLAEVRGAAKGKGASKTRAKAKA